MGALPKDVQYEVSVAVSGDYGESKYVCEQVHPSIIYLHSKTLTCPLQILAKSELHTTSGRFLAVSLVERGQHPVGYHRPVSLAAAR